MFARGGKPVGVEFPSPFIYPVTNKKLEDWKKSSHFVQVTVASERGVAELILKDYMQVVIQWLDPMMRRAGHKDEPVFATGFDVSSHVPSEEEMAELEKRQVVLGETSTRVKKVLQDSRARAKAVVQRLKKPLCDGSWWRLIRRYL